MAEDTWTCDRVMVYGVWTTERYFELVGHPLNSRRCRTVNPLDRAYCLRCGFPRP